MLSTMGGIGSGRRKIESAKDKAGVYISQKNWWKNNRPSGNTYHLSADDQLLVRRAGKILKLKSNSEIIRAALNAIAQKAA